MQTNLRSEESLNNDAGRIIIIIVWGDFQVKVLVSQCLMDLQTKESIV
jgi:hypothetical protein